MTEVELKPYSTYREGDFTAEVSEMGIKEFGEEAVRKAYIDFTDGGAPIIFSLELKGGKPLIEETDRGNVKSFYDLGNFAIVVNKFGYRSFIDDDPENPVFRTEPPLEGKTTTWKAKKTKYTDDIGKVSEYTNFTLINIEGVTQPQQPKKDSAKKGESKPSATTKDNLSELSEAWKEVLVEILDIPRNEAGILKAVNAKLPDDDKRKSMHKVRRQVLQELVKAKFLNISDEGKYNVEA